MKISMVNALERTLNRLKEQVPEIGGYNQSMMIESDFPVVGEINQKIGELENLFLDLKANHKSSAVKLIRTLKHNLILIDPEIASGIAYSVTENSILIKLKYIELFSLKLKKEHSAKDELFLDNVILKENSFCHPNREPNWINCLDYAPYLKFEPARIARYAISWEAKYSKRLVSDDKILNDIVFEILMGISERVKFLKTMKEP